MISTLSTPTAQAKIKLLSFTLLLLLSLSGCQKKDESLSKTATSNSANKQTEIISLLPDESEELEAFTKKANAVCRKTQGRLQRSGTVDLGPYFKRYGINDPFDFDSYDQLPPKAIENIQQAGKKAKIAVRSIQQKRIKEVLSLDVPDGQKKNLNVWASTVRASLIDPRTQTLQTANNQPTKKERLVAAKHQMAALKADIYASLIGMVECRNGNRSIKTMKLLPLLIEYGTFETQSAEKDDYKKHFRLGKVRLARNSADLVMKEKSNHQKIVFKLGGILTDTKKGCYLGSLRNDLDNTFGSGKTVVMSLHGREGYFKLSAKKEDQIMLNTRLIIEGSAVPDPNLKDSHPLKEVYQVAARVARSKKLGVWKKCENEASHLSRLN